MKKYIFFLLLILHLTFSIEHCSAQWLRQDVYVDPSSVYDLKFFDAYTGLICTTGGKVYRTTNGGNNWVLQSGFKNLFGMEKIDSMALYAHGRNYNASDVIYRTFNRGETWDSVAGTSDSYSGISFINRDTGWVSAFKNGPVLLRTTNGGITLTQQTSQVGWGKVFFLKCKINGEYVGWANEESGTWKTTNSGNSWFNVTGLSGSDKIYFINENTGWQIGHVDAIIITTNGGNNWSYIVMPTFFGIGSGNFIDSFDNYNDTLFGTGASRYLGNLRYKGVIWKSTNAGYNWSIQQPDTSYPNVRYKGLDFIDSVRGWTSNLHTTNGGGPVFVSGINPNATNISADYKLEQNYPNPFNSETVIQYSLPKASDVTLSVYDMLGREVINIKNNEYEQPGNYQTKINISKTNLSGGVYFYRLTACEKYTDFVFSESKKLIYIK